MPGRHIVRSVWSGEQPSVGGRAPPVSLPSLHNNELHNVVLPSGHIPSPTDDA